MKTRRSKKTETSTRRRSRLINRQQRKNSCGPTALANMLKWLEYPVTHGEMVDFCQGHRMYDPKVGMFPSQFRIMLRVLTIKYTLNHRCVTSDIDEALDNGNGILFLYRTKKGNHHAVFIDAREDKAYRVWNRFSSKAKGPWCVRKFITDAVKRTLRHDRHCLAFIIPPGQ